MFIVSRRVRPCWRPFLLVTASFAALLALPAPAAAQPSGPSVAALPPVANKLPRATPESQGVSSQALLAFIEALDAGVDTMNSVMVVRRGQAYRTRTHAEGRDDGHRVKAPWKQDGALSVGMWSDQNGA